MRISGTSIASLVLAGALLRSAPLAAQSYGLGDQVLTIGASAFRGTNHQPILHSDGYLYNADPNDGNGSIYEAPLRLPDGAMVTQLCAYLRNDEPSPSVTLVGIGANKLVAAGPPVNQSVIDVNPSFNNSPWIRGAPQSGFATPISRTSRRISPPAWGRPPRGRDRRVQYHAKPRRCHATTVAGRTITKAVFQSRHAARSPIQNSRSDQCMMGLGRVRRYGLALRFDACLGRVGLELAMLALNPGFGNVARHQRSALR